MNPNIGRFISRDTYDGAIYRPITQNHYIYGNDNPARFVDPGGQMASVVQLTNAMIFNFMLRGQAKSAFQSAILDGALHSSIMSALNIGDDQVRINKNAGNIYTAFVVLYSMKKSKGKKQSNMKILPIMNYGMDLREHRLHIENAIDGNKVSIKKVSNSESQGQMQLATRFYQANGMYSMNLLGKFKYRFLVNVGMPFSFNVTHDMEILPLFWFPPITAFVDLMYIF